MFRSWVWALPCWVLKFFFWRISRFSVGILARGNTGELRIAQAQRLDEEFILVWYPTERFVRERYGEPTNPLSGRGP